MRYNFKRYCKNYQDIENYEKAKKDDFIGWNCHHRLETHFPDGKRRDVDISQEKLKALRMYYNRPPEELIFLPASEHRAFKKGENNPFYGKHHTEESKNKMREAKKGKHLGKDNSFYGKHHSEESKNKMREAHKGKRHTEESKKKIAETHKGRHWFNNGKESKFCFECPPGFVPGKNKKALSNNTQS